MGGLSLAAPTSRCPLVTLTRTELVHQPCYQRISTLISPVTALGARAQMTWERGWFSANLAQKQPLRNRGVDAPRRSWSSASLCSYCTAEASKQGKAFVQNFTSLQICMKLHGNVELRSLIHFCCQSPGSQRDPN